MSQLQGPRRLHPAARATCKPLRLPSLLSRPPQSLLLDLLLLLRGLLRQRKSLLPLRGLLRQRKSLLPLQGLFRQRQSLLP